MRHSCTNKEGVFYCDACQFEGTLEQAIEHAVTNQYVVIPPKLPKPVVRI